MGLTKLTLEVANGARPEIAEPVEFLVDSGAIYSVVPRVVLERLGIPQLAEKDFRIASDQTIRRWVGAAIFRYQDRVGGATVVFGEEDDMTLLGALTLEALGYGLDPLRRELIPWPMILPTFPSITESRDER
jgi:aspartyl protease family protein